VESISKKSTISFSIPLNPARIIGMSLLSNFKEVLNQYLREFKIAALVALGAKPVPVRESRASDSSRARSRRRSQRSS